MTPERVTQIRAELHEVAQQLRDARHLDPKVQHGLADLLDELRDELEPASLTSAHATHLAQSVTELARSLNQRDIGLLDRTKDRIEEIIGRAEAESPVIAGVVRRFVDALANIGI